jgi:hypothetical protein
MVLRFIAFLVSGALAFQALARAHAHQSICSVSPYAIYTHVSGDTRTSWSGCRSRGMLLDTIWQEREARPDLMRFCERLIRNTNPHPHQSRPRLQIRVPQNWQRCFFVMSLTSVGVRDADILNRRVVLAEISGDRVGFFKIQIGRGNDRVKARRKPHIKGGGASNVASSDNDVCSRPDVWNSNHPGVKRGDPRPLGGLGDLPYPLLGFSGIMQCMVRRRKNSISKCCLDDQDSGKKRQPYLSAWKATAMRFAPACLAISGFLVALVGICLINWGSTDWRIAGTILIALAWAGIGFGWEHAQSLADKGEMLK